MVVRELCGHGPCNAQPLHGAGAHDPEAVVQPVRVLDGVAFVLGSDLRRARHRHSDGQRVLLAWELQATKLSDLGTG